MAVYSRRHSLFSLYWERHFLLLRNTGIITLVMWKVCETPDYLLHPIFIKFDLDILWVFRWSSCCKCILFCYERLHVFPLWRESSWYYMYWSFQFTFRQLNVLLNINNTVDSRYLDFQGLSEILRDICTSTYQICRIEEKIIRTTTFNKYICNWTLEVRDILKILWKRGEIAP